MGEKLRDPLQGSATFANELEQTGISGSQGRQLRKPSAHTIFSCQWPHASPPR